MAAGFGSVSNASSTGANITSLAVTKPTGLAEGEFMVGVIGGIDGTNDWTLSGWTVIDTRIYISSSRTASYSLVSKLASSGDAAASDFTFGGSTANGVGISLIRITGDNFGSTGSVVFDQDESDAWEETSVAFTGGITPTVTNPLAIMGFVSGGDSGDSPAATAYAVTNNNPTWTERVQRTTSNNADTAESVVGIATSIYASGAATGTYTFTLSGGATVNAIGFLLSVNEIINVTVTGTTGTFNLVGNDGVVSTDASVTGTVGTFSLTGNDGAATTPDNLWANESKNSTTWTNETKT